MQQVKKSSSRVKYPRPGPMMLRAKSPLKSVMRLPHLVVMAGVPVARARLKTRSRLCGLPAFAQYRSNGAEGGYHAWALIVLILSRGQFGHPPVLDAAPLHLVEAAAVHHPEPAEDRAALRVRRLEVTVEPDEVERRLASVKESLG